ncbi:MAG: DUF421 domain-containing protein [Clostridiales bacterium]|nr:DUF421 domain-containing protein [Clostridiales bacterium]MCF8021273.1 DUF421 domain-containing protein [Clostridiales bacterium]
MSFWESQESLTVLQWFLRAVVIYFYMLLLTKLMGQREIGQLRLFDFIIAVTVGSILGGVLSSSNNSLTGPFVTLTTLAATQIFLSYIALNFSRIRRVIAEEPIILIQNGQLLEQAMKKTKINLDTLMSQLRQKNFFNPGNVEFAVLEPNGKLSVIPKSQSRPVTPADLSITTKYEGYPVMLIEDGNIIQDNLNRNNLSESWLMEQLKKFNIQSPDELLVAMLDTTGNLYFSPKNFAPERTRSS